MGAAVIRELSDRMNSSLENSRRELLQYVRENRVQVGGSLSKSGQAVIKTKAGSRLTLRRDKGGKLTAI